MSQEAVPTALFDPAARQTPEWTLHWLFRLALCAEFVGHGGSASLPTEVKEVGASAFLVTMGLKRFTCQSSGWTAPCNGRRMSCRRPRAGGW
jgi:hypothetical protein